MFNPQINKIMNDLIPKIKPNAPSSLKSNVMNRVKCENKRAQVKFIRRVATIAAVVALLVSLPIAISLKSSASPSTHVFEDAATMFGRVKTMKVVMMMRALPNDNFENLAAVDYIDNTLQKSFTDGHWRLEKSGRALVYDGSESYIWMKNGIGWKYRGEAIGAAGVFGLLLNPEQLMNKEIELAEGDKSKTNMVKTDSTIILTVISSAKGIFETDYGRNASIGTSDNRRIYTFDRKSKLLNNIEVAIYYKGKYQTVMKTKSIEYNQPVDEVALVSKPANIKWIAMGDGAVSKNNYLSGNILPEEAVKRIFAAMEKRDGEPVKEAFNEYGYDMMTQMWYGMKVVSVSKSFHSGPACLYFVPCKVVLANGKKKSYTLCLRHDNDNNVWVLDGGI